MGPDLDIRRAREYRRLRQRTRPHRRDCCAIQGEAVQGPLSANQDCSFHVVTSLCAVLALPENGLLTLPSLPRLPFVLQEANRHKQA